MKQNMTVSVDKDVVEWLEGEKLKDPTFNKSQYFCDLVRDSMLKQTKETGTLITCPNCSAEYSSVIKFCPNCQASKIKSAQAAEAASKQAALDAAAEAELVLKRSAEAAKRAEHAATNKETERRLRANPELFEKLETLINSLDDLAKTDPNSYKLIVEDYSDKKIMVGTKNIIEWLLARELAEGVL